VARPTTLLAFASFLAGLGLIAYAIGAGSAQLSLLLVFPVVSGSSLPFLLGVLLTFLGLVGLMASLSVGARYVPEDAEATEGSAPGTPAGSGAAGGVVLLGPVPIFFGAAKPFGRRYYLLALFAAVVLFAAVLVLAWLL
jgi:uncharacterized protein (TIGR00304 family)